MPVPVIPVGLDGWDVPLPPGGLRGPPRAPRASSAAPKPTPRTLRLARASKSRSSHSSNGGLRGRAPLPFAGGNGGGVEAHLCADVEDTPPCPPQGGIREKSPFEGGRFERSENQGEVTRVTPKTQVALRGVRPVLMRKRKQSGLSPTPGSSPARDVKTNLEEVLKHICAWSEEDTPLDPPSRGDSGENPPSKRKI